MALAAACMACLCAAPAAAQPPAEPPLSPDGGDSPEVVRARQLFVEGAALARDMRWGEALERFEASAKLKAHAGTTYNLGICERALGRYTRAQRAFRTALQQNERSGGTALADHTVTDIQGFLEEIEPVLATLAIHLTPASTRIAVDGRPLESVARRKDRPTMVAGTLPPGAGRRPPVGRFDLVLDPGAHVLVLTRQGYAKVVHRQTVRPGSRTPLRLELERMPGTIRIEADQDNAAVAVDGVDVGVAPLTLSRPSGSYLVEVQKDGYVAYQSDATLRPGERVELTALLSEEEEGLAEQWWFWTGIGALVAGAAIITYFAVRPDPEKPGLDGGGLGWTVRVP